MRSDSDAEEARRMLRICAACMYCDGLCPVFPALAAKPEFDDRNLNYLANLCHNCRGCFYACQYAPPHPFAVNLPPALAAARRRSYAEHVWPRWLGRGFRYPALGAVLIMLCALATMAVVAAARGRGAAFGPGAFYAVAPWGLMAGLAGLSLGWAGLSLTISTIRFWRTIAVPPRRLGAALRLALTEILTLRHLDGGGPGCNDVDIRFSRRRRRFHHLMAAGVILDGASTLTAAIWQHAFSLAPPWALMSLPVGLGAVGGLAIVGGAAGLLAIEARADDAPTERGEARLNVVFLIALEIVALSGLALLIGRGTAAMASLLVFHLGAVIGFFVFLPASKALHAPFRAAALLRSAFERQRPRRAEKGKARPSD